MFVGKARRLEVEHLKAYPNGASFPSSALPHILHEAEKAFQGTNTLAYFASLSVTNKVLNH
jgi:hypothetical protein